jgi:pimeloyl-ACP methyl ester carboxylesterase
MPAAFDESKLKHNTANLGEVQLHYVEAGRGPLVLLLHGFPEFWYGWRNQIPDLADAGFRVVAPDLRGYNTSSKPDGVRAYSVRRLARDVARLIPALGEERAAVVGHDWGGIIAWWFAMRYQERLERLAILNAPHPATMPRMFASPLQWLRSAYVFYFQIPWLPEASISAGDFTVLRMLFRNDPRRPDAFTDADIDRYIEAFRQPGALTASLNYYRALMQGNPLSMQNDLRPINRPVLVLWGMHDRALGPELAEPDRRWVLNYQIERFPDASHWLQHDEPERVNAMLREFLAPLRD